MKLFSALVQSHVVTCRVIQVLVFTQKRFTSCYSYFEIITLQEIEGIRLSRQPCHLSICIRSCSHSRLCGNKWCVSQAGRTQGGFAVSGNGMFTSEMKTEAGLWMTFRFFKYTYIHILPFVGKTFQVIFLVYATCFRKAKYLIFSCGDWIWATDFVFRVWCMCVCAYNILI